MAIAFRAATSANDPTSNATLTIPAGVQSGDLMVIVACSKLATGTGTINTPAGWSVVDGSVNGTGGTFQAATFSKVAGPSDAGTTVSVTMSAGSNQMNAVLGAWSGTNGTIRNHGLTDQGVTASTSLVCATQTSSAGDVILLAVGARGSANGTVTFTGPGGTYTVEAQISSTSGSAQDVAAMIADGTASGNQTVTVSPSSWGITGQIVIEAAVAAAPVVTRPQTKLQAVNRAATY